jgi:hypothetical protein
MFNRTGVTIFVQGPMVTIHSIHLNVPKKIIGILALALTVFWVEKVMAMKWDMIIGGTI